MSRAKRRSPGFWSVVLHPIELSTSSKTGEFDETLLFDLPEIQFIPKALQSVLKLKQKTPNAFIFTKNSANLKTWMEKTGKMVGLDALGPVHPYRLRHGGASTDFALGRRTLEQVQRRGRWKSAASVRRYEKGGRLSQLMFALPPSVREQCLDAEANIENIFRCQR